MKRTALALGSALLVLGLTPGATMAAPPSSSPRYPEPVFGPVNVLDQSDPHYQESINDLAAIVQLLDKARAKVAASKKAWNFKGFDYDKLDADLAKTQQQLNMVLLPRTLRLRYQQLIPDSAYFHPAAGVKASDTSPSAQDMQRVAPAGSQPIPDKSQESTPASDLPPAPPSNPKH